MNLSSWALDNGWTSEELNKIDRVEDICLCKCDKSTAVPDSCIPYFISKAKIEELFLKGNVNGCIGWRSP